MPTRHQNARTGTDVKKGGTYFDILAADVKNGTLPSVSWIVAPEAVTEHPAWPAGYGAWYTAGVLDALTSNPDVWSKTALLICFDEDDGFFDHVVAPYPNVPVTMADPGLSDLVDTTRPSNAPPPAFPGPVQVPPSPSPPARPRPLPPPPVTRPSPVAK